MKNWNCCEVNGEIFLINTLDSEEKEILDFLSSATLQKIDNKLSKCNEDELSQITGIKSFNTSEKDPFVDILLPDFQKTSQKNYDENYNNALKTMYSVKILEQKKQNINIFMKSLEREELSLDISETNIWLNTINDFRVLINQLFDKNCSKQKIEIRNHFGVEWQKIYDWLTAVQDLLIICLENAEDLSI